MPYRQVFETSTWLVDSSDFTPLILWWRCGVLVSAFVGANERGIGSRMCSPLFANIIHSGRSGRHGATEVLARLRREIMNRFCSSCALSLHADHITFTKRPHQIPSFGSIAGSGNKAFGAPVAEEDPDNVGLDDSATVSHVLRGGITGERSYPDVLVVYGAARIVSLQGNGTAGEDAFGPSLSALRRFGLGPVH